MLEIEDIASQIQTKLDAAKNIEGSVRLNISEIGGVHIRGSTAKVADDNDDADCVVTMSPDVFNDIKAGNQLPIVAYLMGRLKVSGNLMTGKQLVPILTGS